MLDSCKEHDDCIIVHDTFKCPICESYYTEGQIDDQISDAMFEKDAEIRDLENELADLQRKSDAQEEKIYELEQIIDENERNKDD